MSVHLSNLVFLFALVLLLGCSSQPPKDNGSQDPVTDNRQPVAEVAPQTAEELEAKFYELQEGMTFEQVEELLGAGTRQSSPSLVPVDPEADAGIEYQWQIDDYSIMIVFVDGRVDALGQQTPKDLDALFRD